MVGHHKCMECSELTRYTNKRAMNHGNQLHTYHGCRWFCVNSWLIPSRSPNLNARYFYVRRRKNKNPTEPIHVLFTLYRWKSGKNILIRNHRRRTLICTVCITLVWTVRPFAVAIFRSYRNPKEAVLFHRCCHVQ